MKCFLLLVLLTGWSTSVTCDEVKKGKYLFYFPLASKSIKMTFMPLVTEMAGRGHKITLVTPFPQKEPVSNLQVITITNEIENFTSQISKEALKEGGAKHPDLAMAVQHSVRGNDHALNNPQFKKYLHSDDVKSHFDVIVVLAMFSDTGYYLHHHFDAALVHFFTGQCSFPSLDHAVGNPSHPAYMPLPMLSFTPPLNFWQRFINTLATNAFEMMRTYYILPKMEAVLDQHFPDIPNRPRITELETNGSLALHFGHPLVMDGLRPVMPNFQYIGMMNCVPPKPLPKDLEDFFQSSGDEGVIFVSFGSVLQGSDMSEGRRKLFLNTFKNFKQKILWKWETEQMEDLPANVKLTKWAPQQDVLGHPKLKLFITHGGQSSTQETLCHQKPGVWIPVFGDQNGNALEAERVGFGIPIPFLELTEEKLFNAINKVLTEPSFRENAIKQGKMLVDQIVPPLQKSVWWLEYLIRHPGKNHMRSPALNLPWYQFYLIDVIGLTISLVLLILYILFKLIMCCCCRKKKKEDKYNKKKKA